MVKRSSLRVFAHYFEQSSGQYFYTPDGVGCYWFDSLAELNDALGDDAGTIFYIEKLED